MEEINIPDAMPKDTSIISDPYFVLAAVVVLIIMAVFVRMFFTNTSEYRYNPAD